MPPELLPLLLSSVLLAPPDSCLPFSFQPAVKVLTGESPTAMLFLPIAPTGQPILAVANRGSGTVSFLQNRGDGNLAKLADQPAGTAPDTLAAGDFDADGDLDLAVTSSGSTRIIFFLNDGSGQLQARGKLDLDDPLRSIAVGNFFGDLPQDLAVASASIPQILLFRFRGLIGFIPDVLPLPELAGTLLAGNFSLSGSGLPDLAIQLRASGDFVFLFRNPNDGVMTLSPRSLHGPPDGVPIADDFDGDSRLDLAIAANDSIQFFLSDSSFNFHRSGADLSLDRPVALRAVPLDRDPFVDLAVIQASGRVQLFTGNGDGTFEPAGAIDPGGKGVAIDAADLNFDGRLDLLVLDSDGGGVWILINDTAAVPPADCNLNRVPDDCDLRSGTSRDCDGNGIPDECDLASGPEPSQDRAIPIPPFSSFRELGDLDGDGDLDLIVENQFLSQIDILENDGKGNFHLARIRPSPVNVTAILLEDLDRDGAPDLLFSAQGPLSILWNEGKGLFPDPLDEIAPGPFSGVKAADFNGDGRTDLIAFRLDDTQLSLFLGRDDRRFVGAAPIELGDFPSGIAAVDLDRDGNVDLAAILSQKPFLRTLVNTGGGDFTLWDFIPSPIFPFSLEAADLDGDRFPDFVLGENFSPRLALLPNNGLGGFGDVKMITSSAVTFGIKAVDVDGDDDLDLISATFDLQILRNLGGWRFAEMEVQAGGGFLPSLGDVDGDGDTDLLTSNQDHLELFLNDGTGRFGVPLLSLGGSAIGIAAGDLNGDGLDDVAVSNVAPTGEPRLTYLLGGADGSAKVASTTIVPGIGSSLILGDFNGDGRQDLACGMTSTGQVLLVMNRSGMVMKDSRVVLQPQRPGSFLALASGDLDGDGDRDLVATGEREVFLLLNRGSGEFDSQPSLPDDFFPAAAAVADLDGDRDLDLAVANASSPGAGFPDNVSIYLNDGQAHFAGPRNYAAGRLPMKMLALDFDGDGDVDLIVINQRPDQRPGQISILRNDGSARFGTLESTRVEGHPVGLTALDANQDGRPDIAVAILDAGVFVHYNLEGKLSRGSLGRRAGSLLNSIVAADLDGDGQLEIVAGNASSGAGLAVLRTELLPARRLDCDRDGVPDVCQPAIPGRNDCLPIPFIRGDADDDGMLRLNDAIISLVYLFLGGSPPDCLEALDASGDGTLDVSDPLWILGLLFLGQEVLPPPFPRCGLDPKPDRVGCVRSRFCGG